MEIDLSQDNDGKESLEEEIVKQLLNLRSYLEERINSLEEETDRLKMMFKIIDELIMTKSFKKAEAVPIAVPTPPPAPKYNEEIPLKTSAGTLLATMYVGDIDLRIVPAEGQTFTTSTPPYQQFLVARILEPMRTKDLEASEEGYLMPDQVLSYETVAEGEKIKEVLVKNYGDRKRLREIVSSSRWTLEKMNEKIRSSGSVAQ